MPNLEEFIVESGIFALETTQVFLPTRTLHLRCTVDPAGTVTLS